MGIKVFHRKKKELEIKSAVYQKNHGPDGSSPAVYGYAIGLSTMLPRKIIRNGKL